MEQYGGRAAATTWPMESGQALDVFFDGKDGAYQPGYYRGIVDVAGAPSKTGIQKVDIDFPDDNTCPSKKHNGPEFGKPDRATL
jgi:hypothetical protein